VPASATLPPAPRPAAPAAGETRVYRLADVETPGAAAPEPAAPAAAPPPAAAEPPSPAPGPSAAERYRAAVALVGKRDFKGAEAELDRAIALDPRLAVAYAARASARFGLGRTRDAAADYRAALDLDPRLATPLYGLAECYRLLGDPAAADMYQRYAQSRAADVREELRTLAAKRAQELSGR
jgi:tetratricopeptide (TPR) repeat protein